MKKALRAVVFAFLMIFTFIPQASAKPIRYTPYEGYEYNNYDESVAAPESYEPTETWYSQDMGLEIPLDSPTDMYFAKDGAFYILDSNNDRILEFDNHFNLKKIYDRFHTDEEPKSIVGAKGFTIDGHGNFYIANTENNEVLYADRSCLIKRVITRPDDVLTDTSAPFSAAKVIVDNQNRLYVIVDSISKGAFVYDEEGNFIQFFGTNPINKTSDAFINFIRKRFMTPEQRKGVKVNIPTIFNNFDFDDKGFLYTVTSMVSPVARENAVRRLNFQGNNILEKGMVFGDMEWDRAHFSDTMRVTFVDINIDSNGFVNLLDSGRGKVFRYTPEGKLIAAFGGFGEQKGRFLIPVVIESREENIYVLDSMKNCVVLFEPTEYGRNLHKAFKTMKDSDPSKSVEAWNAVLRQNTNSQYAYYGIGMTHDAEGRYSEAMEQFRLAGARREYSKAFREYRKQFAADHYIQIFLIIALLVTVIAVLIRLLRKKLAASHGEAFSALETKYAFPFYTAFHPSDGFDQFKSRTIMSYRIVFTLVISLFLFRTFSFFFTGFIFNTSRPVDYDFLVTSFLSAGLFILFVSANWAVCTLLNGKGSLKEIMSVCAYSLVPYLISILISTLLSNVLTLEESAFIGIISLVGLLWSGFILIIGLQSIHQYDFGKTIGSIILTLFGMAIIAFLAVLFYTLLQQAANFVRSLMMEMSLR